MNTNGSTIRKGFTAAIAATAFFAVAACGTEINPEPSDISGSHDTKEAEVPAQTPRTSIPRTDFGDEYGAPSYGPTPTDRVDRTKDWH